VGLSRKKRAIPEGPAPLTPVGEVIVHAFADIWAATGIPASEAYSLAHSEMATAIVESQADFTYWLPFNLGDVVLDGLPRQDE